MFMTPKIGEGINLGAKFSVDKKPTPIFQTADHQTYFDISNHFSDKFTKQQNSKYIGQMISQQMLNLIKIEELTRPYSLALKV